MWDGRPGPKDPEAKATPQFHLRVLGSVGICIDGVPVPLRNTKAIAIIAYLCLKSDGFLLRSDLCDLLWPEKDRHRARASFRQCLSSIRRALGPLTDNLLVLDGEKIGLVRDVISTDLEILQVQLEHRPFAPETLSDCLKVSRMFSDIFSISPKFEEWARETQTDAVASVLRQLKDIYKNPQTDRTVRHACAQTALKLDEFDEEAVRILMSTFLENAEPAAALRVYDLFFHRLETEMDAEPASETQELAIAIKLNSGPKQELSLSPKIEKPQSNAPPVALAVLPFEIFGAEQQGEELSLALLEHLTCHLASFRAPSVISSNTTRMYLDKVPRPMEVGRDLNARYILSGSVRLHNDQAALTTQLVEAQTERVIWATRLMSRKREILSLNVPIAEEIARAIVPSVDAEELHLSRTRPAHELEPYHLVLQAKDLIFKLSHDAFVEAGNLLAIAVRN